MALFVEVAKRKSFSQAADALGMPISSLSRRITLFETAVGLRLFDRTTRKLVLTAYGETYLCQATRLVEEAQNTFDDMVAAAKGPGGFLKIAAPPDFWVLRHLSGVISEFSRAHEHVKLHVDLKPTPVDLAGGNYDLAIEIEERKEASLIVRKVTEIENGLYASNSYLARHGWPTHPRELDQHQLIPAEAGASATWNLMRGAERFRVDPSSRISSNSFSLSRRFAIDGQGVAVANVINVENDLARGRLERVLPEWSLQPTPVFIVTTSRLLPVKTRSFIEFVVKRLNGTLSRAAASTAETMRVAS